MSTYKIDLDGEKVYMLSKGRYIFVAMLSNFKLPRNSTIHYFQVERAA